MRPYLQGRVGNPICSSVQETLSVALLKKSYLQECCKRPYLQECVGDNFCRSVQQTLQENLSLGVGRKPYLQENVGDPIYRSVYETFSEVGCRIPICRDSQETLNVIMSRRPYLQHCLRPYMWDRVGYPICRSMQKILCVRVFRRLSLQDCIGDPDSESVQETLSVEVYRKTIFRSVQEALSKEMCRRPYLQERVGYPIHRSV